MKRTLSLSSLLIVLGSLLVLSSCNRNDQKTTLQLHGLGDNLSGLTAYLYDEADPKTPIDSIVIQDTVASLSLDNLQKGYLYLLSCEGTQLNAQFVYEGTSLEYNLSDGLVSGSPANDACNAFEQDIMVIMQADSIDQAAGQEIVRKYVAEQKDNPLEMCIRDSYKSGLPYATHLNLTQVDTVIPDADTHFPEINLAEWSKLEETHYPADERNDYPVTQTLYKRIETAKRYE